MLSTKQKEVLSRTTDGSKIYFSIGSEEVKYFGEAYLVLPKNHKCHNGCKNKYSDCAGWIRKAKAYLRASALPVSLDPIGAGWRPPYFDDPAVREAWDRPIGEVLTRDDYSIGFERFHLAGIHYAGQLFSPTMYDGWFGLFTQLRRPLRKVMYIPSEWKPPQGIPAEWLLQHRKQLAEIKHIWKEHPRRVEPKGELFGDEVSIEMQYMFACMGIFDTKSITTMPERELAARLRKQPGTYPGQNFSQMYRPFELVRNFVLQHRPDVSPSVFPQLNTN